MSVSFDMSGMKKLNDNLNKLDDKVHRKTGLKGVRAGARVYAKNVRKALPKTTNKQPDEDGKVVHLKKSVGLATAKGKKARRSIGVQVGVKGAARKWAHMFEYGTVNYSGRRVFTKTLETSGNQVLQAMADAMIKELR